METFEIIVTVYMVMFILLLFSGFPIAWILGGISVLFTGVGIVAANYFDIDTFLLDSWSDFAIVADRLWAQVGNWVLVALPMFIFMGQMLDRSGIAEVMMKNFVKAFGGVRGGLALTVVLIGVLLAASTGIVGASVVLLAVMSIPIMEQNRYSRELATGVVAASGTLGILIPPSIMLVLMADQLSLPVGDLFMGALIPGLLLGFLYAVYVVVVANLRHDWAPLPENREPMDWKAVWGVVWAILPAAGLILAVLGTIFFGIATPTEASGVGAFGAMLLAALNGKLSFKVLREACIETTHTTCFIFAIFIGATAFSLVMRSLGGDEFIGDMLKTLPFGPTGVVIFILFIAFLLGFFLDWLEITLIMLPLVAPVVSHLGFDMVWFVVIFAVCLQTSFLTPPVGFSLFYLKGVCPPSITIGHIYRGIIPFVLLQLAAIASCFIWPELITWLPKQIYGG
ncbi:MAG TPA: TRAP transporter large permease subunit [Azospirillaceae bacterium]|nr:TRAP transporter large permease subunit [Azospirillaceae bacterium]